MTAEAGGLLAALIVIVTSGLRFAVPLVLSTVGGCFSAQVNVFNVALEGLMLGGAFGGFVVSDVTHSALLGVLAAITVGIALALFIALLCVDFGANEIVVGLATNMAATGVTAVLLSGLYHSQGSFMSMRAGLIHALDPHFLAGVPVLGDIAAAIDPMVIFAVAAAVAAHWYTYHSAAGLRMRAIGDKPDAVAAAGVSVRRYRYLALGIGGALCGAAGAYLPLNGLSLFSVGMTAGSGFIAVAAVIFAAGRPLPGAGIALLFGLASAVGIELQRLAIPDELVQCIPYAATILALLVQARRRMIRERRAAADRPRDGLGPQPTTTPEVS